MLQTVSSHDLSPSQVVRALIVRGQGRPVEGGFDVPEEVEGQLLGFILAVDFTVLLVLGRT